MLLWVLACSIGALALMIAGPRLLAGRWQVRWPRAAVSMWFAAMLTGCSLAVGAVIVTVGAGLSASRVDEPAASLAVTVVAWLSLGAVGAVLAVIVASAEPLATAYRKKVEWLAPVALSRECRREFTLVRFHSDLPVAYSVPGRDPEIFLSTALDDGVSRAQLRAVLAHEYAHLRYRHDWLLRVAELNEMCLPRFVRAGPGLKRATMLLVELIADDAAAKQVGPANLANALARLAELTGEEGYQLRAERLTMRRWPKPSHRRIPEPIRI